jgi:glycine/D-amino acid oxidase-like deaminating enzyme
MTERAEAEMVRGSWYEASVTRGPDDPPLDGPVETDVCVIGAGYAGLSAALELRAHGLRVVVLEAERPGFGASGRNGGQVIPGFSNDAEILRQLGPSRARLAWDISLEGVELIRRRIRDHAIACDYVDGYLHAATSARKARDLAAWVEELRRDFGYERIEPIGSDRVRDWIDSPRYTAAVYDPFAGHFHPLKYCLALADAARAAGAVLHGGSRVRLIERGRRPVVRTDSGRVTADFVLAAGNAYLGRVLPELAQRIMPVRSLIVATERLSAELAESLVRRRAAVSDTNFVLDYFRVTGDDRLLFGGRVAARDAAPQDLVPVLRQRLAAVFPQAAYARIEHEWGGLVDLTLNRAPDFGRLDGNLFYLQGFSGHGVALAGIAGKLVAEAIAGQAERFDLFGHIRHRDFPGGPALHGVLLRLGILYYRLREMF